jgi:hypothetical protein
MKRKLKELLDLTHSLQSAESPCDDGSQAAECVNRLNGANDMTEAKKKKRKNTATKKKKLFEDDPE